MHVFSRDRHLDDLTVAQRGEPLDRGFDELARSRGAGGQTDDVVPGDQVLGERALAVDQLRFRPGDPGDLDEALGVRARL